MATTATINVQQQQHRHCHQAAPNTINSNNNERCLSTRFESLDYDHNENVIFLEHQRKQTSNKSLLSIDLQRWLVFMFIGIATGLTGFAASITVSYLTKHKFEQIIYFADNHCAKNSFSTLDNFQCFLVPFLFWSSANVLPSLFGSLLVTYLAPVATGSGIPVVKCYLNGVRIPQVVRLKTFIAKLVGVVSSVVGGLACGKEGPFVHCGAVIGAGISQGRCTSLGFDTGLFKAFRNDRDKRDFVSAGASAGVSCAFGAPVGGLLFALEEGASFWDQLLVWRIFFCSMVTSFTLNLAMSIYNDTHGFLSFHSLVNFGQVRELDYFWYEVPIYIVIAVLGGLTGASFCYFNLIITKIRDRYIKGNLAKTLEVILTAAFIAICGSLLILLVPDCRPIPTVKGHLHETVEIYNSTKSIYDTNQYTHKHRHKNSDSTAVDVYKEYLKGHVLTFMCPKGQYSAMSSLWLKTSESDSSAFMVVEQDIWPVKSLIIFFFIYYILALWTYGLRVSGGIFIPSLLIGAAGGRLIAKFLERVFGPVHWLFPLNKFAIIGAASTLGGVVRMTISLTVIVIEATGAISFGLPIMTSLIVSKWVADLFIEGLYDIAIHQAKVPFLGWNALVKSYSIYATDVMSPSVVVLKTTETVGHLIHVLNTTSHNGFPVVDIDPVETNSLSEIGEKGDNTESALINPTSSNVQNLFMNPSCSTTQHSESNIEFLQTGSFQRCFVTFKRKSHGRYRGIILRSQLIALLQNGIVNEDEDSIDALDMSIFIKSYPKVPSIENVMMNIDVGSYNFHVDLRPVMNSSAYTVLYSASFPRIYTLFRSLGLRHLVVTDDRNEVVGIITRKDLARYVRIKDKDGTFKFIELDFSM